MKLVFFADLHLDAQFAWAGYELGRRRRQALRETLRRIIRQTHEVAADALLCAGDLYEHERFSPDTGSFLQSAFEELHPIPVYIAPGNHDWYGPESLYHRIPWSPNVRVFRSERLEPVVLADGITLWGAAHRAPAGTRGFLEDFQVDRSGLHLALFHGSEQSFLAFEEAGKNPHAPFQETQVEEAGLHHAFVGHYHQPRDAGRYTYPGNPEPLTFGEQGERGLVIVTMLPDGTLRPERRRVAVSELHDLKVDVTGCRTQEEVRDRITRALRDRRGAARVTLFGELATEVDFRPQDLSEGVPGMDRLFVRAGNLTVAYDLDAIAREPTVRGQFVRDVREAELDDERKRRILITGLRALDRRTDLEVF